MKKMILALILAATCVAPALAISESEYYSWLEAFRTTNASTQASSCQNMYQWSIIVKYNGAEYPHLAQFSLECFDAVQHETQGELPTKIPLMVFSSACTHLPKKLLPGFYEADRIIKMCAAI